MVGALAPFTYPRNQFLNSEKTPIPVLNLVVVFNVLFYWVKYMRSLFTEKGWTMNSFIGKQNTYILHWELQIGGVSEIKNVNLVSNPSHSKHWRCIAQTLIIQGLAASTADDWRSLVNYVSDNPYSMISITYWCSEPSIITIGPSFIDDDIWGPRTFAPPFLIHISGEHLAGELNPPFRFNERIPRRVSFPLNGDFRPLLLKESLTT